MRPIHLAFALAVALALAPAAATAKAWQGVTPGATTETEVAGKFGAPSTQGKLHGRVALVYKGDQAIAGTRQAQFFARDDGVVVEIVVFPANPLDRETVEGTYGKASQKAFTDDFRTVWLFKASGVTVYFGKDGHVEAISFKAPEAPARAEAAHGAAPRAQGEAAPASPN